MSPSSLDIVAVMLAGFGALGAIFTAIIFRRSAQKPEPGPADTEHRQPRPPSFAGLMAAGIEELDHQRAARRAYESEIQAMVGRDLAPLDQQAIESFRPATAVFAAAAYLAVPIGRVDVAVLQSIDLAAGLQVAAKRADPLMG
jgi:hypothetical protein